METDWKLGHVYLEFHAGRNFSSCFSSFLAAWDAVWMFEICHIFTSFQFTKQRHSLSSSALYYICSFNSSSDMFKRELNNKASLDEYYSVRRIYRDMWLHFVYSYTAVTISTPSQHSTLEYICTFFHTKLKMVVAFSRCCQLRHRTLLLFKTMLQFTQRFQKYRSNQEQGAEITQVPCNNYLQNMTG